MRPRWLDRRRTCDWVRVRTRHTAGTSKQKLTFGTETFPVRDLTVFPHTTLQTRPPERDTPSIVPTPTAADLPIRSTWRCVGDSLPFGWVPSGSLLASFMGDCGLQRFEMMRSEIAEALRCATLVSSAAVWDSLGCICEAGVHNEYEGERGDRLDITTVELDEYAPEGAKLLKRNVKIEVPQARSYVRALRYTKIAKGAEDSADEVGNLRQVDVPVSSHDTCPDVYNIADPRTQVCTGYVGSVGRDSC